MLMTIDDEGSVDITQLAGRAPVAIRSTHVEIGDSRLDLRTSPAVAGLVLGLSVPDPLRCEHAGQPVLLDVDSLAIVDDHPTLARGRAVVRSLQSQAATQGLTTPDHVLTAPDDPLLESCLALLEIGARWRARWMPDMTRPEQIVRLHAAGMAQVFMNSDARRSAMRQPSSVRTNRSANSPTTWRSLGTMPNVTSGSSDRVPATISTTVVA